MTTVRAVTKQRVIEALADSDCCSDQQAAALEVGGLSLTERLKLLDNTIGSLTSLLYRIKVFFILINNINCKFLKFYCKNYFIMFRLFIMLCAIQQTWQLVNLHQIGPMSL